MAGWDDVRGIAMGLPRSEERESRGQRQWRVGERLFVWERPLRRPDLDGLGDRAPAGPILGARIAHVEMRGGLIAEAPEVFFTIPHFDGYPAILVQLDHISVDRLTDLVVDAWLDRAPTRLAEAYRQGTAGP